MTSTSVPRHLVGIHEYTRPFALLKAKTETGAPERVYLLINVKTLTVAALPLGTDVLVPHTLRFRLPDYADATAFHPFVTGISNQLLALVETGFRPYRCDAQQRPKMLRDIRGAMKRMAALLYTRFPTMQYRLVNTTDYRRHGYAFDPPTFSVYHTEIPVRWRIEDQTSMSEAVRVLETFALKDYQVLFNVEEGVDLISAWKTSRPDLFDNQSAAKRRAIPR